MTKLTNSPAIQKKLLKWFGENQRALPWREKYEPYQVWISEIMLQQTQVKTALPYFDRWMQSLPDIASVSKASEDHLLKLWEGLGYYSRVRNIKKAAQQIMSEHGGVFPSDYDSILALPGVGKYTAGAIASIAFNQDRPLVDGNVMRVLSRIFLYSRNTRTPEADKLMWKWAEEVLPKGEARAFNQAMMEFGALQCTPSSPNCALCPLASECGAYQKGIVSQIPDRGPKKFHKNIRVALAVIKKDGKVFIQRRPSSGLMGGLWEFPGGKIEEGESPQQALGRELIEETGFKVRNMKILRNIKHAYTSYKVDLHCYEAEYESGRLKLGAASQGKWVKIEDLKNYAFPAANVELIASLH